MNKDAIAAIASAVFDKPVAQVIEAYSSYDRDPREFSSAHELTDYIIPKLADPLGHAFLYVVYLDMEGRANRKTIFLNQEAVQGHHVRYTWEGWGLISIIIERGDDPRRKSRVSANSEKRAVKWMPTYPEWEPPSVWNWKAVSRHAGRLARAIERLPVNLLQPESSGALS